MKVRWIESEGGPLIFASSEVAKGWLGVDGPVIAGELTDYQRACSVVEEIGVLSSGAAEVVVLGDEPDRTALIMNGECLYIVRWRWADSEDALLSSLESGVDNLEFSYSGEISTFAGRHVLFDSSVAWNRVADNLIVELACNRISIETAIFEPNSATCALIHRLRRKE